MIKFRHYTATGAHGEIREALVILEDTEGANPPCFFEDGVSDIEEQGIVEMSGEAEHMLGSFYEYRG